MSRAAYHNAEDELADLEKYIQQAITKMAAEIQILCAKTGIKYYEDHNMEVLKQFLTEEVVGDEISILENKMDEHANSLPSDFQMHNTLNRVQQGTF